MNKFLIVISIVSTLIIHSCSSKQLLTDIDELSENAVDVLLIPTPSDKTSVLYGVLRDENGKLIQDGIFLSRNISYKNPEIPPTISFSFQNSPRAMIEPNSGFFYFLDIEPADNYVLTVLIGPNEFIVVKQDDEESLLMIEVQAGKSLYLGSLIVELP
jgi:hypothetical protein